MKIAVTGATGFVGSALTAEALRRGHEVIILTRRPEMVPIRVGAQVIPWGESGGSLPRLDAVINLASENVAGEWTEEKKRRIVESRQGGTRRLVDALQALPPEHRPGVLASASGIGYYAEAGDAVLDEDAPAGNDFMAEVCKGWEAETRRAEELGVRAVMCRLCVVLGPGGGMLAKVLPRFRQGQGAPLGDGRKWFAWIHRADVVGLFLYALEQDKLRGPVNAVSPGIVRGMDFARTLAEILGQPLGSSGGSPGRGGPPGLGRPPGGPPPTGAGEPGVPGGPPGVLVASHHVVPRAALAAGYNFRFPDLAEALKDIVQAQGKS
jgi:uncharacterized protein (TIGR01777 family)